MAGGVKSGRMRLGIGPDDRLVLRSSQPQPDRRR
jgi:hypothetical protein